MNSPVWLTVGRRWGHQTAQKTSSINTGHQYDKLPHQPWPQTNSSTNTGQYEYDKQMHQYRTT